MTEEDRKAGKWLDRLNSNFFNQAAEKISGLDLEETGENSHDLANRLWKISEFLKKRSQEKM